MLNKIIHNLFRYKKTLYGLGKIIYKGLICLQILYSSPNIINVGFSIKNKKNEDSTFTYTFVSFLLITSNHFEKISLRKLINKIFYLKQKEEYIENENYYLVSKFLF